MTSSSLNHPFVVWAACILWLLSIFATGWSLVLFFCVGDILFLTGTDLVNALVLLSGIVMLPTNFYILYSISNGKKIELSNMLFIVVILGVYLNSLSDDLIFGPFILKVVHKAKVLCCRLWLCIIWVIIISLVGVVLCVRRMYCCHDSTIRYISGSMKRYKSHPKHKNFIDNLQWTLNCCGLHSYNDWFSQDWHDKIRDYEWDPIADLKNKHSKREVSETDSVPLSCCKSGSCISNFLNELGTHSINTNGCVYQMSHVIFISMTVHLIMFLIVIILEIMMLKYITNVKTVSTDLKKKYRSFNLRHIMPVKENFNTSSGSYQFDPEDSDEIIGLTKDGITHE